MMYSDLLQNILLHAQMSEPGKLHITDMGGALVAMRRVFCAGLSASKFRVTLREFILLDAD